MEYGHLGHLSPLDLIKRELLPTRLGTFGVQHGLPYRNLTGNEARLDRGIQPGTGYPTETSLVTVYYRIHMADFVHVSKAWHL